MKKLALGLFLACLGGAESFADQQSAMTALRNEPTIKDFAWKGPSLWIGVLDDGSRRDGYAQYVCTLLAEHGVRDKVHVRIMDVAKAAVAKKTVELGDAWCP